MPERYIPATESTPIGPSNVFKYSLVSSLISNSAQKQRKNAKDVKPVSSTRMQIFKLTVSNRIEQNKGQSLFVVLMTCVYH